MALFELRDEAPELSGKRVLITGGGGFIGAWTGRALASKGAHVTLVDLFFGRATVAHDMGLADHPNVRLIHGDVLDVDSLTMLAIEPDYVIHAAAVLGIERVRREPINTLRTNVIGTDSCLEYCARQAGLRRAVVLSTSEVYGPVAERAHEGQPLTLPTDDMRWCYASSKLTGEWLVRAYAQERALPTVVLRPFNVYGPYRKGDNAVTSILTRLLANESVSISGDGSQVRAWCYVEDFVQGLIAALIASEAVGETINVGNPKEAFSIYDLAVIAKELTNSGSEIVIQRSNESDVRHRVPSIEKARRILSFKPETSLIEGLQRTIAWLRSTRDVGSQR
jgi:UDP-glucose 4-epimerase